MRALAFLLVVPLLLVGCMYTSDSGVTGSGPVVTQSRDVGSFDKVESSNGLRVVISIGDTTSVTVSAQENIQSMVSTTVADGTLEATLTGSVIGSSPITVNVVMPTLTSLTLHDGTSIDATDVAADALTLTADNGAHVNLAGTVNTLTLNAADGVLLQLGNLVATNATIDLSNGVTGAIHATGSVSGSASNGVLLSVVGGGAVNVSTSGGAFVTSQ